MAIMVDDPGSSMESTPALAEDQTGSMTHFHPRVSLQCRTTQWRVHGFAEGCSMPAALATGSFNRYARHA
jgi:hypothetical protein